MKNKKFDLVNISDARLYVLGIATLLIALFHSVYLNFYDLFGDCFISRLLEFIKSIGNIGVEFFLFYSGLGLYFSYKNNSVKQFYIRRIRRVIPKLFLFIVIYYGIILREGFLDVLIRISMISFFTNGDRDLWFFFLLLFLYFIFPIIYQIVDKYRFIGTLELVFILIIINMLLAIFFPSLYNNIEIALTRIPIFVIGSYFGKMIDDKRNLSFRWIILCFVFLLVFLLFIYFTNSNEYMYSIYRFIYCPLSIMFIFVIVFFDSFFRFRHRILKKFGKYSINYYLLYEAINNYLFLHIRVYNYIVYYIFIVIIIFLLSLFEEYIFKKLKIVKLNV